MPFQIDLIRANGARTRHDFSADQVTMGRAYEADLPIPEAEELEPIHLLIMPRGDGAWVSAARECRTIATIDGKPFENGVVPWGTEIDIGSVTVHLVEPRTGKKSSKQADLLKQVLVILVCGAVAIPLFMKPKPARLSMPKVAAPTLFEPTVAAGCPSKEAGAGAALAADGYAKLIRYPYDAQDGVEAVALFDQAKACLLAGGAGAKAAVDRVVALRTRLATQMEDEYRVRRLRLAVVLSDEKYEDALTEIRFLTKLLAHRPGEYVDSLNLMHQRIQLRLDERDGKKKKKKPAN